MSTGWELAPPHPGGVRNQKSPRMHAGQGVMEPEKVINLSLGVQRVPRAEPVQPEHPCSNYRAIIGSGESQTVW